MESNNINGEHVSGCPLADGDAVLVTVCRDMSADVVALITAAMNPDEGAWADRTLACHFAMEAAGLDDGRRYFALLLNGTLVGVTGLHHYEWGPDENVWLGWFAVTPELQGQGLGAVLMRETERAARSLGFRKLFIETYDSATFFRARRFYERSGFKRAGMIQDYLPDGSAMIVFLKELGWHR